MKRVTIGLLVLLAVLHQDFWWWDDGHTLVFGFMPVGLAYHAGPQHRPKTHATGLDNHP